MEPKVRKDESQQRDDSVWTWAVIGVLYVGIMLALYGPFIWERLHGLA